MNGNSANVIIQPVVSKQFCSTSQTQFIVRKRPCVVNGGGFVVTNCGGNEVFRAEGCGPMVKNQAVLKDGEGNPILAMKRKVGVVQVFCFQTQWKGFVSDGIDGCDKPIFKVTASAVSCCQKNPIKVSLTNSYKNKTGSDYKIVGSFAERDCVVYDHSGAIAAEIFVNTALNDVKDIYSVAVRPGVDQAFVFGLVAILDKLSEEDHGY
jgi:uncharacterized protein YxjI